MGFVATASAAEGPRGTAQPSVVAPGHPVTLLFEAPATPLVEATVFPHVTCVIAAPGGASTSCGTYDELLTARGQPAIRTYSFSIEAPTIVGDYTITFTRTSTVSVPGSDVTASATLHVLAESVASAGGASGAGALLPSGPSPLALLPGLATDGARWLASVSLGTAALLACVVAARRGGS